MDAVQRMYNRLEAGSVTFDCGGALSRLDPFVRTSIFTGVLFERLQRKNDYILDIYRNEGLNWEQVVYILLFRFLGAPSNTEAFEKLARSVSYAIIKRYVHTPEDLEALLIGGSGLLDLYYSDSYTETMRRQFAYFAEKYRLKRMSAGEWNVTRIYPHNHPVLRLAQAVSILSQPDFGIERVLACRSAEDIGRLFMHEASSYWFTHFIPGVESPKCDKRIGRAKAEILAVNVVAPVQFSYGSYIDSDRLRDRALNLLDSIQPERNSKVRRWTDCGFFPRSAFDTQVLIQLGDQYCLKRRCRECPVGDHIIKTLKETCKVEENK